MSVLKTYTEVPEFVPSLTYKINGNRIQGAIDGIDAMQQAIKIMLESERYETDILSEDYGLETSDIIGARREVIEADLQRRIKEVLAQDDRVLDVSGFTLEYEQETAKATFAVNTVFGDLPQEVTV